MFKIWLYPQQVRVARFTSTQQRETNLVVSPASEGGQIYLNPAAIFTNANNPL